MYRNMRVYVICCRKLLNSFLLAAITVIVTLCIFENEKLFRGTAPIVMEKIHVFMDEHVIINILLYLLIVGSAANVWSRWQKYTSACCKFSVWSAWKDTPGPVRLVPVFTWTVGIAAVAASIAFLVWCLIMGI